MKKISILYLLIFLTFFLQGQILLEEVYGNAPNFEHTNSIVLHDNVVVLAGYTTLETNGGDDILLVKLDTTGNLIWKKQIGGAKNERANKIKLVDDGYIIAGHTKTMGNGNQDFYLIKTDFDGEVLWERTYGTANLENCVDFVGTPDGGFLLLGNAVTDEESGEDWYLIKTDSNGNQEWEQYYGGEEEDIPTFIHTMNDGNYLLSGAFGFPAQIIKIDESGQVIWTYDSNALVGAFDVLELENDDLLFPLYPGRILRLNSDGDEIYSHSYVFALGLASSSPVSKFEIITEDSILMLNQIYSYAIEPSTGDTLSRIGWEHPGDYYYHDWNDIVIGDGEYFIAGDHKTDFSEWFRTNGFTYERYDQGRIFETNFIDTFQFNSYNEYTDEVIETFSGDILNFGARFNQHTDFTDKILLTKTDANGALLSEFEYDKGFNARPVTMHYTGLGNVVLLTQINSDTMELSMVNTDGVILWTEIIEESYNTELHLKNGLIQDYLNGQYILILGGRDFYVLDDEGLTGIYYQSNVNIGGFPSNITVLPSGRFMYVKGNRMVLLEEDASWLSYINFTPVGYSISEYYDYQFNSEDDIWLVGQTSLGGSDSAQYVVMNVTLEGERLSEAIFGGDLKTDIVKMDLLKFEGDRVYVHGNKTTSWPYSGFNVGNYDCLRKPLSISYLEEWSVEGEVLRQLEIGIGQGVQIYDMIETSDNDFVGVGWKYDTNSDDQYLIKIDQTTFVPTTEAILNDNYSLIYPNPGHASLHFYLESSVKGRLELELFSLTGQMVLSQQTEKSDKIIDLEINTSKLAKGNYFLRATVDGEEVAVEQFLKM